MSHNITEQEAINLCICLEAVGDIANQELFTIIDVSSLPGQAEIRFHSHIHNEMFLIRLLDFVKERTSSSLTGMNCSCIDLLKAACKTRSFDVKDSVTELSAGVKALEDWLSQRKQIDLWLPSLDIQVSLEVSRLEFLNIAGNYSKHNLSRLTAVSRDIAKMLASQGYSVDIEHIPLALDDFREHLHENYFAYYGTWLAELVNNIRWGIQSYLLPEFNRAYERIDDEIHRYKYNYPSQISGETAKQWYWRLMNNIRTGPYHKRFSCAYYLKGQSCLEK